ncbi:MAG TPA: ABC transporter substrate-binding protein [Coleofasciculaceae cyanobacterium]
MTQKNETTVLVVSLATTLALVAGGLWWFANHNGIQLGSQTGNQSNPGEITSPASNQPIRERISGGEKSLIPKEVTSEKQTAVKAIASGNYAEAVSQLETSLKRDRNDPEALIYLNNARIGNKKSYTIAASVPISSDLNGAQEILRGVAQAQNEVNQAGGIKGIPLKVLIANDDNDPGVANKVAAAFVKNSDVLGVVGHYASDVSLATADTYQSGELVAISPISTTVKLSGRSRYVFRTVPSDYVAARALADYMLQTLKQQKVAVFYSSQSGYSQSLKSEFVTAVSLGGGQVINEFDLSDPNFNAAQSVNQTIQTGAQALMLAANTGSLDKALQVVQVNGKRLSVLAGDDVYTPKTLELGGLAAENMVLAIPWHILGNPQAAFPKEANQLWGGEVNWRTATAYDAAKALIAGLERNPTRTGVQQALLAPDISAEGAAGAIRFLPSGDRNQGVQLVRIQAGSRTSFGYEFVPIR